MSDSGKSFFRNLKPEFKGKKFSEIDDNFFKKKSTSKKTKVSSEKNTDAKTKQSNKMTSPKNVKSTKNKDILKQSKLLLQRFAKRKTKELKQEPIKASSPPKKNNVNGIDKKRYNRIIDIYANLYNVTPDVIVED